MASFLIDLVLAVMLCATTVFLVLVNRRLKSLRAGREEIEPLIHALSKTVDEADASTKRLVAAAAEASIGLADNLEHAKTLREDVGPLLDSCDRASRRIEESIRSARLLTRRLNEAPRPRLTLGDLLEDPEGERSTSVTPSAAPANETTPLVERAAATTESPAPAPEPMPEIGPERGHGAVGAFYARLRTIENGR